MKSEKGKKQSRIENKTYKVDSRLYQVKVVKDDKIWNTANNFIKN